MRTLPGDTFRPGDIRRVEVPARQVCVKAKAGDPPQYECHLVKALRLCLGHEFRSDAPPIDEFQTFPTYRPSSSAIPHGAVTPQSGSIATTEGIAEGTRNSRSGEVDVVKHEDHVGCVGCVENGIAGRCGGRRVPFDMNAELARLNDV
jgi:hypothetical protein